MRQPPAGFHTATPSLTVRDAPAALAFYARAFGAVECLRLTTPDGTIVHAEFRIGDSLIMIGEENPEWGSLSPSALNGTPCAIHLYVDDADAVAARAVGAGATEVIPVADQFYGDRSGRVQDPFGHLWVVATRKEEVPPDIMQQRLDEFMARMAGESNA